MKIGLSLGSGGARGYAHIGVLQALEEAGIKPDLINGSSIGAIIGGAYALYYDSTRLVALAKGLVARMNVDYFTTFRYTHYKHRILRDWALSILCDISSLRGSILSHRTNQSALSFLFGEYRFSDTKIPFAAVAVDLISETPVVIKDGRLRDGILPSISIPGVFPAVERDGMFLVDGGVLADVPVRELRADGADFIIAVKLGEDHPAPYKNGFDLLTTVDFLKGEKLSQWELDEADFTIEVDLPHYNPMCFTNYRTGIERGYTVGKQALPALRAKLDAARATAEVNQ